MEFFKSGRNGSTSDIVGQLNFFGKDASGSKVQFGGIETLITSAGGVTGVDGALDFYTCVNGTKSLVFRMNGADNENNSFRPLDMNGNAITTSLSSLTITTSTSAGTGNITLISKGSTIISSLGTASITTNTGNITFSSAVSSGTGDIIGLTTNGNVSLTANVPSGGTNGFCILNADRGVSLTSALGGSDGNVILNVNNIGDLQLEGTTLQSSTSGANSGQHLRIKLNGTYYKIRLEND
jgi:hypothetical protein